LVYFLAHDRDDIDDTLEIMLTSLFITAVLLLIAVGTVIPYAVRRGLRPLRKIVTVVERIHADSLDDRIAPEQMPSELAPICNRLNELLARLHDAFERERRFSSDVAHELRTPIAELRTMAEVALRWPQDAAGTERNFRDTLDIAGQMESIVSSLLTIARCEAGAQSIQLSTFGLSDVISEAWTAHQTQATAKALAIELPPANDATMASDRTMLKHVLSNLFSNAVNYSPPAGRIACTLELLASELCLTISNPTDQLAPDDLAFLFDPFWRKDAARSDSSHSGLGLSIVASYARLLGLRLGTSLVDGRFAVALHLPIAAANGESQINRRLIVESHRSSGKD
jgi:two-component system sensor histidine kinase QseC